MGNEAAAVLASGSDHTAPRCESSPGAPTQRCPLGKAMATLLSKPTTSRTNPTQTNRDLQLYSEANREPSLVADSAAPVAFIANTATKLRPAAHTAVPNWSEFASAKPAMMEELSMRENDETEPLLCRNNTYSAPCRVTSRPSSRPERQPARRRRRPRRQGWPQTGRCRRQTRPRPAPLPPQAA